MAINLMYCTYLHSEYFHSKFSHFLLCVSTSASDLNGLYARETGFYHLYTPPSLTQNHLPQATNWRVFSIIFKTLLLKITHYLFSIHNTYNDKRMWCHLLIKRWRNLSMKCSPEATKLKPLRLIWRAELQGSLLSKNWLAPKNIRHFTIRKEQSTFFKPFKLNSLS